MTTKENQYSAKKRKKKRAVDLHVSRYPPSGPSAIQITLSITQSRKEKWKEYILSALSKKEYEKNMGLKIEGGKANYHRELMRPLASINEYNYLVN